MIRRALLVTLLLAAVGVSPACSAEPGRGLPAGVTYEGPLELRFTERGRLQWLVLELASAWATCDLDLMASLVTNNVDYSFPTTRLQGKEAVLNDVRAFCATSTDTSVFFPVDSFYIDPRTNRIAAELQFRSTARGARQVVNDVWIGTVDRGKFKIVKEYLDGRVRDLQALGVLEYDPNRAFLTPWPPRTPAWADCFPIVRAAPINTCPPTSP